MVVPGSPNMGTEQQNVKGARKHQHQAAASRGILQQNRQFLDFFWDIAKPDQDVRLAATENLIQYLKSSDKEDEMKYTLKRLVEGLAATREAARPGFSLALAQVLQCFEDISLSTVLEHIYEKHNLQKVKKKMIRNAVFGNFFGVLSLFQSGRLAKETSVLLQCVQLLQNLAHYREHLKDLPRKTLVDILSEIPESTFEEVLFGALQADLTDAFSTPEQLHLLLVGMQKFPGVLKPKKLKKLLGSTTVICYENIPKLVELLKIAAKSVKKERLLPGVALDVMRISLKEDAFLLFWSDVVDNGLLRDQSGPCNFMCYRLLGAALPLLDLDQLQTIIRGEVMLQYGLHVVSAQPADRFKFAPEMETYVDSFMEQCDDSEKQLAVLIGFTSLTNQGYPVIPSAWKVIRHLKPDTLQKYIDWLKGMFITPDLESCLDFSTRRQKEHQGEDKSTEYVVFRLRKWLIPRLTSIIENSQVKRDEAQVMDIARFMFFHAFFETKKPASDIPETECSFSVPLDDKTRAMIADAFFSLLLNLNCMPVLGSSADSAAQKEKHVVGITADGTLWIQHMVNFASSLLSKGKVVKAFRPFSEEEKEAWDRMLQYVEDLQKKTKKSHSMELSAYRQLLLLVGIHLFKTPEESVDLLSDIHNCLEKAQSKKGKKKNNDEEPEWVEVMVEILLSLFSQPSRLFRLVSRNVFKMISQHVTKNALRLILNVLDPEEDENEESAVVVTDDKKPKQSADKENDEENSLDEDSSSDEDEADDEMKGSEDEEEVVDENANELFRKQLMDVLSGSNTMGEDSDNDDLDDEAMMALDENIASLFAEQKKRIQAKKDEKARIRVEKILRKEFKTKVLDLVEIFVKKQPESPLVFDVIEPLISVIEQIMNRDSSQQDQDFLRKTADIFMNDLCKAKRYCKDVSELKEDLQAMLDRLIKRACKQHDSSVALYCFSASLYLFKVLKNCTTGNMEQDLKKSGEGDVSQQTECMGCLDLQRVTVLYKEALNVFMTKRNSPLTAAMFNDLFTRFPFMCKPLLGIITKSVKDGARQHQQGQACTLLLKILQTPNLKQTMSATEWNDLIKDSVSQIMATLQAMSEIKLKIDQQKVIKCFELLSYLIKIITQQKLDINLTELHPVLQTFSQSKGFGKSVRIEDMFWNVMKLLGFTRPKKEKSKVEAEAAPENTVTKKKKGFLPETKKRKNRKKPAPDQQKANGMENKLESSDGQQQLAKKSKKKKKNKRKAGQHPGTGQDSLAEQLPPSKKAKPNADKKKESEVTQTNKAKKKKKSKKAQSD